MQTEIIEILEKAKRLISRKNSWIRHAAFGFRKANGKVVRYPTGKVNCWCAFGAIEQASGKGGSRQACEELAKTIDNPIIAAWNDKKWRTQAQVVAAFKKTIDRLKQEQELKQHG